MIQYLIHRKGGKPIKIIDGLFSYFNRRPDADMIQELDLVFKSREESLLRDRALKAALNMISRSLELVEWQVLNKGEKDKDSLYYKLNVAPNKNHNASEFWSKVVYQLMYHDGEVLIIVSDDDQLLVADDFDHKEYALMEDLFYNVQIGEFKYERSFLSSEVIYIKKENEQVKQLTEELDKSYGRLFSRMIDVAMRTNQIRGKVKIDGLMSKRKGSTEIVQDYIDKIYGSYQNDAVAIVPEMDGMDYSETSLDSRNVSRIDEAKEVSDQYLNEVLQAFGIHPSLVYGESSKTNIEFYQNQYLINVIKPLAESIEREFNTKFFTQKEYLEGSRVQANTLRIQYTDVFGLATSIEKLVGSKTFTPNETREMAGYERVDDPSMDEFYITKNFEGGGVNTESEEEPETSDDG